jgi:N-acyl homoserine lactone hydrolase
MFGNYVIHPIALMTIDMVKPKLTYLFNYGQEAAMGIFVWYLEGPRENILVDAGITPERLASRGYKPKAIQTLDEGLGKLGLEAGDIDIIIVTHTHHDHIALARRFPKAKFIIQRAELEFARNPHPFFRAIRPKDFMELIEGVQFEVVEGDTRIDDGIELLLTPGHTPGCQSVAVKTAQGTAIVAGWCGIRENFDPPPEIREAGLFLIPPGIHTDVIEAYESVARVKHLADLVIPVHEMEFINKATVP